MTFRFLIYISHSYGIPIGEPLEREIERHGYEVRWFADMAYSKQQIAQKNTCNNVQEIIDFHPHVVLTATDSVPDFIPGIKVQVFHGFLAFKHSLSRGHFRIRGFLICIAHKVPQQQQFLSRKKKNWVILVLLKRDGVKLILFFPLQKG